jgi:hypothetical protein
LADGIIPDTNSLEAAQEVIKELASHRYPTMNTHISPLDLEAGYKVWRERTATSPSGLHLGHYRTITKHKNNNHEEGPSIKDIILDIESIKANIALQHGYILKQWEQVINLMLEKVPGFPKMDRLRVIHIFEADLNLILGIIWNRRLVRHADKHKANGEAQWGGRPGRGCEEVLFLKKLTYMLFEVTRTPGASFDNDATACYDRIVMALTALRGQQLGIPTEATNMITKFLENAKYHIKTMIGLSEKGYTSTKRNYLHGPGQGGKASPGIWTVVSSLIMRLLHKHAPGVTFSDPTGNSNTHRIIDGFVDDTTAWINQFKEALRNN